MSEQRPARPETVRSVRRRDVRVHHLCVCVVLLAASVAARPDQRSSDNSTSEAIASALRTGRYAEASRLIENVLGSEPNSGLRNIRDMFRGRPDMEVKKGVATSGCDVSDTGLRLHGSANGQPVSWLFDTGANFSLISDTEAARLGMAINEASGRAGDLAGGSVAARTATAERLTIGSTEMRRVTFLVTSASEMPWIELPPGQQGIIGMPIAMALESVHWSSDDSCIVGSSAQNRSPSAGTPLFFARLFVMAEVTIAGKPLRFTLDTGNQTGTQLWPRFGREFSQLVAERGTKSIARLTQIGGAADHPTTLIPDLRLGIGGTNVTLANVHLFSAPVGDDSSYGLLGIDVFAKARDVTIDFQAMRLVVR
jgi:Aspartyl protease